ncbi:alpha/beta hydrolase [Lysinibacillus sp. BW-2-10]|uniref:alpha/beta hydrolase family protein n=1 Tax=Lysinibacillus sp. BW-2-10 TaxID=2590030 RepID=UPI002104FE71|nr:alpha/beta hydrolase [Lysinibacillus sp. BW-2-10]
MLGTLLFFLTIIFEIAFATYCIVTKQNHKKFKNWMRIGEGLIFFILIISSTITWSFRWILPLLLFILLFAMAIISLMRNRDVQYKTFRIVRNFIAMTLLIVLAFAPVLLFPQYKMAKVTGDYDIATATYTYVDENRTEEFSDTEQKRFVNVQFWYPETNSGSYPLVVFSHGANGVKASNTSTFKELASHGYVVCSIDHTYHSFFTASNDGSITMANKDYLSEISNANKEDFYTREELHGLIQKWMTLRTDDINFVIDTILSKSKKENAPVYKLINTDLIGVFGHSMGAAASVGIGGERNDVKAVVNIDGPLFSELVYDQESDNFISNNKEYSTPLLNIYSDDVWEQLKSNSTYAANNTIEKNGKEVYSVHFQGAKHLSFTDLSLVSPILATVLQGGKASIDKYECIEKENELIVKFFDHTLKNTGPFSFEKTY